MMKKIILLTALFVSLIALAGVTSAAPVCGSTCPSVCSAAGQLCSPEEQQGSSITVQGNELSCVKKQNVGCSLKFDWPFVQGNVCPTGFTRDVAIDGLEDCGFLGLGAIFGGSVKYCHVSQQVSCAVNATCQSGFQVQDSSQCSVEQSSEGIINQCCELGSTIDIEIDGNSINTNATDYGEVTSIQIRPAFTVVPLGGEVQFTAVGVTPAGLTVDLVDDLVWRVSAPSPGNISSTGIFTACMNCTGGQATILVSHGPLTATATASVVQITDYRIEPQNVSIAVGGAAILKATALNVLTGQRENITSTWSTNVGSLRFPATSGQQSSVAILRGSEIGNGSIQARVGSSFAANATVNVISPNGFEASQLVVYPNPPFRLSDGQVMTVDTDFFIVARSSSGVYGPLPGAVNFSFENDAVATTTAGGTAIQGVAIGQTTLNISTTSLWTTVPVIVTGCPVAATATCTSTDAGYLAANGVQSRICAADGTWGSCTDPDTCDNAAGATVSAPVQGVADGRICSNWCQSATSDPDCSCNPANETQRIRVCSDSLTHCWGLLTCGANNAYGSCVASPSCTGELFSGFVTSSSAGLFNGYVCGTTAAIPVLDNSLSLASSQFCTLVGSAGAITSITTPGACQATQNVSLYFNAGANPPEARYQLKISRGTETSALFKLLDVTQDGVRLNVTDGASGTSFPLLMLLDNSIAYNANITLTAINMSYVELIDSNLLVREANFTVEYDSCLFDVARVSASGT